MTWQHYVSGLPDIALPNPGGAKAAVKETHDLVRIRDAAWRPWDAAGSLDEYRLKLTHHLRTPGGTRELKHVQAAVLGTAHGMKGCFAPVRTGGGKTDISLLAPEMMQAARAVLFVPASVREKTKRNLQALSKHYRVRALRILSYESLSLAKNAEILIQWQPDLLILDEAHMVKDSSGARWKRIRRYDKWCEANGKPLAPMLAMSGSFTSRSIREYWHIIRRCIGLAAPLPKDPLEMAAWALALDEKVPDAARVLPGALLTLAPALPEEAEFDELKQGRLRYGRRLNATQGVVSSGGDMPPCGLEITIEHLPPTPPIAAAVQHLRATWETPCGLPFETAMDLWRHERELSCGLYYRWKYQPPPEWLTARRDWSMFVRDILSRSKRWDTPMQISQAVQDGRIPEGQGVHAAWMAQAPTFKPDTEPVWICDSTLQRSAEWLEKRKGICWVHHGAFGEALESLTGVPYFRQQGRNKAGIAIDQHDGPAIASIASCSTGFDLQGTPTTRAKHYQNFIVTCPTKNAPNEQLLSRTHRDLQIEDTVFATYLQRLEGDEKALAQSRADASMVECTTRAPQRLTVATWVEE
jgi:hypothetical protein